MMRRNPILEALEADELGSADAVVRALNPAAWYRFGQGITDAAGAVSQWDDQSGNARHLKQATAANRPAKQADGSILFDGVSDFLKADAFALVQPETVYLLFKQVSWTNPDTVCDGNAVNTAKVTQVSASPGLSLFAGGGSTTATNNALAVGSYGVMAALCNGANSFLQLNGTATATANIGAASMGGFTLGAAGDGSTASNIQVKEAIIFAAAHDAATIAAVIAYLNSVGGL